MKLSNVLRVQFLELNCVLGRKDMKVRSLGLAGLVVFALAHAAPAVAAQSAQTTAPAVRAGRYEKAAETTVSGTVAAVQAQPAGGGALRGTYVVLRSGASTINVHMGLFSAQNIPFKSGASVKVTGSLATVNGAKVFLAREVESGGQSLVVRSTNGFVLRPHTSNSSPGLQP
jgi:hypothetical protein